MRKIRVIAILLFVIITSCGDNNKSDQEKIIGIWIGYNGDNTAKSPTDTFIFTSNTLFHNSLNNKKIYQNYSLSNSVLQYQNVSKIDSLYDFKFTSESILILDPIKYQVVIGLDPKYYLTKK